MEYEVCKVTFDPPASEKVHVSASVPQGRRDEKSEVRR